MAVKNKQLAKKSTAFQFLSFSDVLHPKSRLGIVKN